MAAAAAAVRDELLVDVLPVVAVRVALADVACSDCEHVEGAVNAAVGCPPYDELGSI